MKSKWTKWLAHPGKVRAVFLDASELMRVMSAQHSLKGMVQGGFGEAVVGALLVSSAHKSGESINVNVQGSGYFKQAIIDASPDGRVRGFIIEQTDESMRTFGVDGNAGPWGTGILSILYTKSSEGKVPYTGMVHIATGILDDAFNEYYKDSEQRLSKIGIAIELKGDEIVAVHGALVQVLGGAGDDEVEALNKISTAQMRTLAKDGSQFKSNLEKILPGLDFRQVEESEVTAFCNCNQDRIERALILAGEKDILDALGSEPLLEISCDFCCKQYKVSAERLKALYAKDRTRLQ